MHICFPTTGFAEVSCRDAIRQARVTRVKSRGMTMLRKVHLKRSESGAHHVFRKCGQSLEVKISKTDLPSKAGFPYVAFSDWLRYAVEYDQLEQVVGVRDVSAMRKVLATFWQRYQQIHPTHAIYQRGPEFPVDMTLPVLVHGDEGRGLKKKQVMILSTHGLLGKGSHQSNHLHPANDLSADPLRMNYVGNTMLTHFLFAVMPVQLYNETPEAFYQMLDIQAREFAHLFEEGLDIRGTRFYVSCLGVKGDAPYLAKAGMFNRSFLRRPTRATSKKACSGVCHLCMAGKEDVDFPVPFEEYGTENPAWLGTVGLLTPYDAPSPLLQIPFDRAGTTETLFRYDLFHNWHSGMGKYFAASAICICLELIDASIDQAFEQITADFKEYCARKKECPYHKKLTKSLFGVEQGFRDCPDAGWSKGDFTRLILQWFGNYCERHVVGHTSDDLYLKCVA